MRFIPHYLLHTCALLLLIVCSTVRPVYAQKNSADVIKHLHKKGHRYLKKAELDKALDAFSQSLSIAERVNEVEFIANSNYYMCIAQYQKGNYKQALEHCFNTTENINLHNNDELWRESMFMLVKGYEKLKQKDLSTYYKNKLYKFYWENGRLSEYADFLFTKGEELHDKKQLVPAIDLYEQANVLYEKDNDKIGRYKCNNSLAEIHALLDKHEKAIAYNRQALQYAKILDDTTAIANSSFQLGRAYLAVNEFTNANDNFSIALNSNQQLGNKEKEVKCLNIMADVFYKQEAYLKAVNHINMAIEMAHSYLPKSEWEIIYMNAAKIYAKSNTPEKGTILLSNYIKHRDEVGLNDEKINDYIEQIELTHAKEQALKDIRIASLEQRQEIHRLHNIMAVSVGFFLLVLLILAVFSYYFQRRSNRLLRQANVAIANNNEKLQAKNSTLEDFAFIASHDLKEPIRTIGGYVTLLERRYSKNFDADTTEFISFIKEAVDRMQKLLNDIFDYSVIAKDSDITLNEVAVRDVIDVVAGNLQMEIHENAVQIRVGKMPIIQANKSQIIQLFQNLIANAIKFRGVEAPIIQIYCQTDTKAKRHIFTVKDNGIGIAPEYHQKVFDAFKRLNTRDKYAGNGIGLAICAKIVAQYKGEIWIQSDEGKGSMFCFSLPITKKGKIRDERQKSGIIESYQVLNAKTAAA